MKSPVLLTISAKGPAGAVIVPPGAESADAVCAGDGCVGQHFNRRPGRGYDWGHSSWAHRLGISWLRSEGREYRNNKARPNGRGGAAVNKVFVRADAERRAPLTKVPMARPHKACPRPERAA